MIVQAAEHFGQCEQRLAQAVKRYTTALDELKERYSFTEGENTLTVLGPAGLVGLRRKPGTFAFQIP
jgi:hypothetical protein